MWNTLSRSSSLSANCRCHCFLRSSPAPLWSAAFVMSHRGFVQDVYKDINYEAPFTNDEKTLILNKLNSAKSPEELNLLGVTKATSSLLMRFLLQREKPLEVVEQLLDVKRFDPAAVERVGKAILRKAKVADLDPSALVDLANNKLRKHIRPAVDERQWDGARTTLALKFNLRSISYALVENRDESLAVPGTKALAWGTAPLFDNASSRAAFEHHRLYETAQRTVSQELPPADLYVFEENPAIGQKDPYVLTKTHLLLFQASLVALLNAGRDRNRVFAMRNVVVDTVFSLRVGMERIKLQSKYPDIVAPFNLRASDEAWRAFNDGCEDKATREQMGTAMLVALAFKHLMDAPSAGSSRPQ